VFSDGVGLFQYFCHVWKEEVCMQLLAKSYLLNKDAKELEVAAYSDFISVLRKRI
jgi:hypothetical protein